MRFIFLTRFTLSCFNFGYSSFTKFVFPEGSFDEKHIKHHKCISQQVVNGFVLETEKTYIVFSIGTPINIYGLGAIRFYNCWEKLTTERMV